VDEDAEAGQREGGRDVAKYVVIGLALAVAAVGAFVVLLPNKGPAISYRTLSVDTTDPKQAVVTFEVDKAPLAQAECQVTATGRDREIVNRLTGIVIGPTPGQRVSRHTVTVPTDQPATGAAVASCTITKTR
jgi:hypothetical protein